MADVTAYLRRTGNVLGCVPHTEAQRNPALWRARGPGLRLCAASPVKGGIRRRHHRVLLGGLIADYQGRPRSRRSQATIRQHPPARGRLSLSAPLLPHRIIHPDMQALLADQRCGRYGQSKPKPPSANTDTVVAPAVIELSTISAAAAFRSYPTSRMLSISRDACGAATTVLKSTSR